MGSSTSSCRLAAGGAAAAAAAALTCLLIRKQASLAKYETATGTSSVLDNQAASSVLCSQALSEQHIAAAGEVDREVRTWSQAFVEAAGAGQLTTLESLLQKTPPSIATGHLDLRSEIPPHHSNVTAVYAAAAQGQVEVLRKLMELRADPNLRGVKATSWDGAFTLTESDTALCLAAREGHVECVRTLLEAGANPNIECEAEYMEGAVEWGEEDDGTETNYYSALDVANMFKQPEVANLIQSFGGAKVHKPSSKPLKVRVTQGSRMGA